MAVTAFAVLAMPAAAVESTAPGEAPAETAPPAPKAKPSKDDPDRIVCVRERVLGSNRPHKVCMTVAERDRMRDAARRLLTEQRGATEPLTAGGR